MTKKQQLYYIVESFIDNGYDVQTFCKVFEELFYPDIPKDELSEFELSVFNYLGDVVSRYSPYNEDVKTYFGIYNSEIDVKKAIISTYKKLKSNEPFEIEHN